jgi:spore coat protein U-like protein
MIKQMFSARTLSLTGVLLLSIGAASTTEANTAQANLSVTASVTANCTIATTAVAFGSYDPVNTNASAALNGSGSVSITCTSGASATVTLGQGANADTGSTDAAPVRRLTDGTHFLNYALYTDTNRTAAWGNTSLTGVASTGTGAAVSLSVYGAVSSGQNVPAGSYTDTVVATVTF